MLKNISITLKNIDLNEVVTLSDLKIKQQTDVRGFCLLMLAAEAGNIDVVKKLIARGEEVNNEVDGETPISLAFDRGHHEVVVTLLKANSKFPCNFKAKISSDEFKIFLNLSLNMHNFAKNGDCDKVKALITENPALEYFYSPDNDSVLKTAILNGKFEIYELLLSLNIFLAPHESMDDLLDNLNYSQRKKFSEINFKLSPELVTEPMMILLRNCKFGPDNNCKKLDHMNFIKNAFEFLFKIPLIAIILKIVAASRNFKIIFDFKRDFVTFLDPRAEPYTNGLFYTTGRIYIAAKDMLHKNTASNTISVIAHELCHYAMLLVYENDAKPYREKNHKVKKDFSKISNECESNKSHDEIIELVYDCYDEDFHHAELIVRIPQMIAMYSNSPSIFNEKQEKFCSLFDFYEKTCVPQMETALPKIEKKFNPFRKQKIQCWLIIFLTLIIGLIFTLSILGAIALYNPAISWSDLNNDEKFIIKNATVNFYDINVKFGELFGDDSNVYDLLSSEQIKITLKNDTRELSKATALTFKHLIFLKWFNMTESMRKKFLRSIVNFQGQNVSLNDLNLSDSTLNCLNSEQILKTFDENFLTISEKFSLKSKFHFERFFIDEKNEIKTFHYFNEKINANHINVKSFDKIFDKTKILKVFLLSSIAGEGKSTTFKHFTLKLKEKNPFNWVQFVDLKKHLDAFELSKKLDLTESEKIKVFLAEIFLKLESFKSHIFSDLFDSGKVIFLWDGVDEISSLYKDLILNLTFNIKNLTENLQFISTRPQHSQEFNEKLNIKSYKLIPLGKLDSYEFLTKYVVSKNYENVNAFWSYFARFSESNESNEELCQKVSEKMKLNYENILKYVLIIKRGINVLELISDSEISSNINSRKLRSAISRYKCLPGYKHDRKGRCKRISIIDFSIKKISVNPLIIKMIAEVCEETSTLNTSLNFYGLFEKFVMIKRKIVNAKGEAVNDEFNKVLMQNSINSMHQVYALKLICKEISTDKCSLISKTQIFKQQINQDAISKMGILQIFSQNNFNFIHKTFGEFFFAQFLIDDFDMPSKIGEFKLKLIMQTFFTDTLPVVKNFLLSYSKKSENISPFSNFLTEHNSKLEEIQKVTNNQDVLNKFYIISFSNFCVTTYNISCEKLSGIDPLQDYKFENNFNKILSEKESELVKKIGEIFLNEIKENSTKNYFENINFVSTNK